MARQGWMGLLLLVTALAGSVEADQPAKTDAAERQLTVELTFDFGDGFQKRYVAVPHRAEMTILDALEFARNHPHGTDFKLRGTGATTLLTEIDKVKNQGGNRLNWIFRVNGKLGKQSFAVSPVQPGDTILWKFDTYQ